MNSLEKKCDFRLRTELYRYIRKLRISSKSECDYISDAEIFSSLETLSFFLIKLNETNFSYMRNVFENIENIHLEHCDISVQILEQLAADCPKLKRLVLNMVIPMIPSSPNHYSVNIIQYLNI